MSNLLSSTERLRRVDTHDAEYREHSRLCAHCGAKWASVAVDDRSYCKECAAERRLAPRRLDRSVPHPTQAAKDELFTAHGLQGMLRSYRTAGVHGASHRGGVSTDRPGSSKPQSSVAHSTTFGFFGDVNGATIDPLASKVAPQMGYRVVLTGLRGASKHLNGTSGSVVGDEGGGRFLVQLESPTRLAKAQFWQDNLVVIRRPPPEVAAWESSADAPSAAPSAATRALGAAARDENGSGVLGAASLVEAAEPELRTPWGSKARPAQLKQLQTWIKEANGLPPPARPPPPPLPPSPSCTVYAFAALAACLKGARAAGRTAGTAAAQSQGTLSSTAWIASAHDALASGVAVAKATWPVAISMAQKEGW